MSIKLAIPSNHLILCCPLLLLPSIFPSIRIFSNESVLRIRWPKYWSFSFSISPSNEYSGLIQYVSPSIKCHCIRHGATEIPAFRNSQSSGKHKTWLFSSHLQSFPASGSFQMSQFLASGGQSIGVSASASVLPMNIQDWFPLGIDWLYPPCSPSDSQESSPTPQFKSTNSSALSLLYSPTLTSIHDDWKNHSLD